jgi:hypothetical protein
VVQPEEVVETVFLAEVMVTTSIFLLSTVIDDTRHYTYVRVYTKAFMILFLLFH